MRDNGSRRSGFWFSDRTPEESSNNNKIGLQTADVLMLSAVKNIADLAFCYFTYCFDYFQH